MNQSLATAPVRSLAIPRAVLRIVLLVVVCSLALSTSVPSVAAQAGQGRPEVVLSNATLTFHIIEADGFDTVDPAIADVVEELQKLFRYRGYRLLSTSVLSGAFGEGGVARVSQMIATPGNPDSQYRISAMVQEMPSGQEPKVRILVELQEGHPSEYRGSEHSVPVVLEASVNLAEEQTVVLGSARPHADAAAIILVVTPSFDLR